MKSKVMTLPVTQRCLYWSLCLLWLGALLSLPAYAAQNQVKTYLERFPPASTTDKHYRKDIHVWVYTRAFAKRFGMPDKWIDDDLQGAQALAYRMDLELHPMACRRIDGVEQCRNIATCVIDIYVDEQQQALPWNNPKLFDTDYGKRSLAFLKPQNPDDIPEYITNRTHIGKDYRLGVDRLQLVTEQGHPPSLGDMRVLEYDRQYHAGLDYLGGQVPCQAFAISRDVHIVINPLNGGTENTVYQQINSAAHHVTIPNGFMDRIQTHNTTHHLTDLLK